MESKKRYEKTLLACYLGFVTQAVCAKVVDKIGYRPCIVAAEIASGIGLAGLAILPDLMSSPLLGILICVIIYAIGVDLQRFWEFRLLKPALLIIKKK